MIDLAALRELTSDEVVTRLPRADDDAGRRAWWANRGIIYHDLERFCLEDAEDTVDNVLPNAPPEAAFLPPGAQIAALCAMSTEVGFMLGWLACERSRA